MADRDAPGPTSKVGSEGYDPVLEPLAPHVERDIARYVAEAIARFGAPGGTFVEDMQVVFFPPSGRVSVPLGPWARRWDHLDEAAKRQAATELARRLAQPRALQAAHSVRPPRPVPWSWLGGAAVVLGALGWFFLGGSKPAPALVDRSGSARAQTNGAAPDSSDVRSLDEHAARAARVCEATRARVVRGATVGPTDVDGWVVEFHGLKTDSTESLVQHPALARFVEAPSAPAGSRFVWSEEKDLASVETSDTRVRVTDTSVAGAPGQGASGIRLTFEGALVDPYFDPEKRVRFYHVADGLASALGTTHAALVARCAAGSTHHLGSWFRGPSDGEAAVSLVYFLGTYAEPPHLAAQVLRGADGSPLDRSVALGNVRRNVGVLDRAFLASVLGNQGGMVIGKSGEPATITFPFRDGNRASRASREIARLTNLGAAD